MSNYLIQFRESARSHDMIVLYGFVFDTQTHKKTELQKIQQDTMILELSLKKAIQTSTANEGGEEYSLGNTIENITTTLSKIAEKRRSQVNR